MEGVQILNQFEVVTKTTFSWQAFWVGALIGVGIALFVAAIFGLNEQSLFAFFFMFGFLTIFIAIFIGALSGAKIAPKPVAYETHYEVTISDDVNMKEFMDKYEIVETRGAIYTVREKDVIEG